VRHVDPGPEDRDRDTAGVERPTMGGGIDPNRTAAHGKNTRNGESSGKLGGDLHPRCGRTSGTDDGDPVVASAEDAAPREDADRRIRQPEEHRAIVGVSRRGEACANAIEAPSDLANVGVREECSVVLRSRVACADTGEGAGGASRSPDERKERTWRGSQQTAEEEQRVLLSGTAAESVREAGR
jgi:hypothetical protein